MVPTEISSFGLSSELTHTLLGEVIVGGFSHLVVGRMVSVNAGCPEYDKPSVL